MSNNLSSRLLRYVSMTVSLFLGLNVDLGLNFSYENGFSSFLKCHISRSFLPYSSNSDFVFALSILLDVRTNFRPLDNREISASERFLPEILITLLLTNSPSNLPPLHVPMLLILPLLCFSSISRVFPALSHNYLIFSRLRQNHKPQTHRG